MNMIRRAGRFSSENHQQYSFQHQERAASNLGGFFLDHYHQHPPDLATERSNRPDEQITETEFKFGAQTTHVTDALSGNDEMH